ncbi:MAG: LPXTG cell wall anchor domain-containing protein [Atopobium minutum]|uniref:lectin like domain-containing protein n=1 Tax=Atopobium minutum TaxID=1381 RepID=UPI001DF70FA4|nr:lectin like domain-containing protein [Atopobium minutum]MBS4873805.1 LPXTG cell wall anchor domain-containing protein [Atopobium minutum]
MNDRYRLKVLNAKASIRAWSKRRTLHAIAAAALAILLSSPMAAHALESVSTESVASHTDAVAVERTDAVAVERTDATVEDEDDNEALINAEAVADPTPATPAADPTPAAPTTDPAAPTTDEVSDTSAAADPAPAQPEPGANTNAATAPTAPLTAPVVDNTNSYGTKVIFDFNGDGKTDAEDWKAYLKWMHEYKPFDFDLATSDLGDSHNGGLQITGATQLLVNGQVRRLDSIDTNLNIEQITQYYLNNLKQTTPVKNQSPFGTCWAFASISALESAILKAQGGAAAQAYNPQDHMHPILSNLEDNGVDLSELYLAWMAYDLQKAGSQKGEGQVDVLPIDEEPDRMDCGGWATMAETLFTAWKGVATEKAQPYWPKGVEMTFENFLKMRNWHDNWGLRTDKDGKPEEGKPGVHVDGVYYLPNPNNLVPDKNDHLIYKGHNDYADKLIKQALVKYGAVQIGYGADSYRPGQPSKSDYFNGDHWAQYCDATEVEITHAVTIVGWDDNFDPSKFQAGKNNVTGLKKGAWLVKNSWNSADWFKKNFGVDDATAAKMAKWGIVNDKGEHTGYFWLSYYDHSINTPSYFTVDLEKDGFDYDNNYSYDFLINQSQSPFVLRTADKGTQVANVFKANGDETLRAVSVHTGEPNSKATIQVYVYKSMDAFKDNDPTNDGMPVMEFTYDATVPGMHTVKLPRALQLKAGQIFAIVQNITGVNDDGTTNSYLNLETGMSQNAQFPDKTNDETKGRAMGYVWSTVVANDGETYVKLFTENGYKWVTPKEIGKILGNDEFFEFGNALIKAFTTNGHDDADRMDYKMEKETPKVIKGKNAIFVSSAPFTLFKEVRVDGKTVDPSNYTAIEGSTDVTLSAAFIKTLALGEHTIDIISEDGMASAKFSVADPESDEPKVTQAKASVRNNAAALPATGDASTVIPLMLMGLGVAIAGSGVLARRKDQ